MRHVTFLIFTSTCVFVIFCKFFGVVLCMCSLLHIIIVIILIATVIVIISISIISVFITASWGRVSLEKQIVVTLGGLKCITGKSCGKLTRVMYAVDNIFVNLSDIAIRAFLPCLRLVHQYSLIFTINYFLISV